MNPQVLTDRELMDWWIYWQTNVPLPEDSKETSVELFVKYLNKQSEREAPIDYTIFGTRELGIKWLDYIRTGDPTQYGFGPGNLARDWKASRRLDRDHSGSSSGTGDVSESNLDDMPVVHPQREV